MLGRGRDRQQVIVQSEVTAVMRVQLPLAYLLLHSGYLLARSPWENRISEVLDGLGAVGRALQVLYQHGVGTPLSIRNMPRCGHEPSATSAQVPSGDREE